MISGRSRRVYVEIIIESFLVNLMDKKTFCGWASANISKAYKYKLIRVFFTDGS
jgi:hypothetical protein